MTLESGDELTPGVLSDEELVARGKSDTAALNELLGRYFPRVRVRARAFFLQAGELDDLHQEGMIGLFKAIQSFRPDAGASFRTFAEICVGRQIVTAVRSATSRRNQPLTGYVSISGSADDADQTLEVVSDDDPARSVLHAEEAAGVQATLGRLLSLLELEILRRHLDGETRSEIARRVGRDAKAIENALHRIRRKVEAHLAHNPSLAIWPPPEPKRWRRRDPPGPSP
jgi:RNA polymerase sigma-H factor